MTLSEFRESKFFKNIGDISVVHWCITVVPGLASGAAATMHGRPLETVILYFVGACALMFVLLHYGTLAWAKYWPKITQKATDEAPRKHWRLTIPILALVVMVAFGWFAKPKPVVIYSTGTGGSKYVIYNGGKMSHSTITDVQDCTGVTDSVIANMGDTEDVKYKNVGRGGCGQAKPQAAPTQAKQP
jgi:hypothetical protein